MRISDPFTQAIEHLNGGDHGQAIACLRRVLNATPQHPVALTLMGISLLESGDLAGAEGHLRRALALSPGRPEVLVYLAKTTRLAGRPNEAAGISRALLARQPDSPDALAELAAACTAIGAIDEAIGAYRRIATIHPRSYDIARALATNLSRTGKAGEAERVLRTALGCTPAPGDAATAADLHHNLAGLLRARRAFDDAIAQYRAGEAAATANVARMHMGRAIALQHLRRFDEAVAALRAAIALDPLDMASHLQLNELLHRQARDADFLCSYDDAARAMPTSPVPLIAKGHLLLRLGRPEAAIGYFDGALARSLDDIGAIVGRARSLEQLGRIDAAAKAFHHALRIDPSDPRALIDAAGFFLRQKDHRRVLALLERALSVRPNSQEALALLTLYYRAVGDPREFEIARYDMSIGVFDLDPPAGFDSMTGFNRELAHYLGELHGDVREHFTQTLRGGTRLYDSVFHNGHDLVDRLQPRIDRAVASYIEGSGAHGPAAFSGRRATSFSYASSWSSRLVDRGFHTNHMHPEGWISSVYYVAVPDVVDDDARKEGWLKFGEPSPDFGADFTPRRYVKPKVGRLVLFPSYVWHGTNPFSAGQPRMTIAFDVVPGPSDRST